MTRPGRCGNPFRIGVYGTAEECVAAFDLCISEFPVPPERAEIWVQHGGKLKHLRGLADGTYLVDLQGHDLACYCGQDQPCHRNVLLRRANQVDGVP